MNFASDNTYGAMPEIIDALRGANEGAAASYGDDPSTGRLTDQLSEIFEHEVSVYPVISGTAANALALATLVPPHGAIFCHVESHIAADECGAPEFFTHGAKLITIEGANGKMTPASIKEALGHFRKGFVHHVQPAAISVTQATECGTCYSRDELSEIAALARAHEMHLHMDGARFANAIAGSGCTPAQMSWQAGVDALSFGATKNGALCAEAVIFFDRRRAADFAYRRKKSGHLISKMRFISAQFAAYLAEDRWLKAASRANGLAQALAEGLLASKQAELAYPVEANAVFVLLPDQTVARLRKGGAVFHEWGPPRNDGRTLIRLVLSFATPQNAVSDFIAAIRGG